MNPLKNHEQFFIQAYDKHSDAIFRYCLFRVYDREKAKELMQETFTKTWEYLIKDNNPIINIRAFLYKVAHNICVNEIMRSRAYSLDEMMETNGFDPKEDKLKSPEDNTELRILFDKLQLLNKEEQELLTLRYIDDLKVTEIAKFLNKLPNTVSVKISRAENSLKKLYQQNGK